MPFYFTLLQQSVQMKGFPLYESSCKASDYLLEAVATICTAKGPFPSTNPHMLLQSTTFIKAAATNCTTEGFSPYESSFAASDYLIHSFNDSEKFLTVNTHRGLHVYHRLSHGVSSALSIFQGVMDQILQGLDLIEFNRVEH